MRIRMRLEVHFHEQDVASVLVESSTAGDEEPSGELMLFCLFVARMLANLGGRHTSALGLAELLCAVDADGVRSLISHEHPDAPRLVGYQGSKGRKGFLADLNATDEDLGFTVKPWGLGLAGRGADYYTPNAAMLFLRHLGGRREDDDAFLDGLAEACQLLGAAFRDGQLTIRSQGHIAMSAWAMAAANLPDTGVVGDEEDDLEAEADDSESRHVATAAIRFGADRHPVASLACDETQSFDPDVGWCLVALATVLNALDHLTDPDDWDALMDLLARILLRYQRGLSLISEEMLDEIELLEDESSSIEIWGDETGYYEVWCESPLRSVPAPSLTMVVGYQWAYKMIQDPRLDRALVLASSHLVDLVDQRADEVGAYDPDLASILLTAALSQVGYPDDSDLQ